IAERGAGIAATGKLFALDVPLTAQSAKGRITLSGASGRLAWKRVMTLDPGSSAIVIEDSARNQSDSTIEATAGSGSEQQREPWQVARRSWSGDLSRRTAVSKSIVNTETQAPFGWRVLGQYGIGFLYRVVPPAQV